MNKKKKGNGRGEWRRKGNMERSGVGGEENEKEMAEDQTLFLFCPIPTGNTAFSWLILRSYYQLLKLYKPWKDRPYSDSE